MSAAPRRTASAQLAEFIGLELDVILPGNARLVLREFTTRSQGPHVRVDATYLRHTPRVDLDPVIKHYELREITADGAPS